MRPLEDVDNKVRTVSDFNVMMVAVDLGSTADRKDRLIVRSSVIAPDSSLSTNRRATHIDESHFHLCPDDHRRRVWRRPGQLTDLAFFIARHTSPPQGVTVWDVISFDTPTVRRRHSENCFATIPFAVLWPYCSEDKARTHAARVAKICLSACQTLPWQARSPDPLQ
ncbi:transposable element Tc1 transposase [Trichonephila clavipes]|nr:transposable element Tc1 transposase [Trichonephila clavipes]